MKWKNNPLSLCLWVIKGSQMKSARIVVGHWSSSNPRNRFSERKEKGKVDCGYTPRRQASRRWRHRPWWLWSHQGDSPPSRRAPSMPSSRRRVSSDRSSSARGRRRDTGSDRDPLPPGPSGLASSALLLGSTGVKLMPRHSRAPSRGSRFFFR